MGGDVTEAVQIIETTMKVGGEIVLMPWHIAAGGIEALQKILQIMELAREMHPEKGEVPIDVIYEQFGNQYSIYSVKKESVDEVREALAKKGVVFSHYADSEQKGMMAFAIPHAQAQMAVEALDELKIEYLNQSIAEHADDYAKEYPERFLGATEQNFNHDTSLREFFLVSEHKEMLATDHLTIEVPRAAVKDMEKDGKVVVLLNDNSKVILDRKGLMPREDKYVLFVDPGKMYEFAKPVSGDSNQEQTQSFNQQIDGNSLFKRYFSTSPEDQKAKHDLYMQEANNRMEFLKQQEAARQKALEEQRTAQEQDGADIVDVDAVELELPEASTVVQQPVMQRDIRPGEKVEISVNRASLIAKETEDSYIIRVPRNYKEHTDERMEETSYGGYLFVVPKSICKEYPHPDPKKDLIRVEISARAEYTLTHPKTGQTINVSANELYHNFDMVQQRNRQTRGQQQQRVAAPRSQNFRPGMLPARRSQKSQKKQSHGVRNRK